MKKIIFLIIRALISAALIIILVYMMRGKYHAIVGAVKGTKIAIFILALFTFICAGALASLRLKIIVNIQNIKIRFREALSLNFIGYFFNNFLPTSIGGDVVKAYYLSRKKKEKMPAFTAIFIDRVIGLITMIFMAFIALLIAGNQISDVKVRYAIYLVTLMALGAIIFMTNRRIAKKFSIMLVFARPIEDKLKTAYNVIHRHKHHTMLMCQSFAISIASQLMFFLTIGILAVSIGSRIPALDLLLRMPIVSTISLLPSINGLGVREGATVVFFGPIIGRENAFVVSILLLAVLLVTSLVGGAIYALSPQFKMKH